MRRRNFLRLSLATPLLLSGLAAAPPAASPPAPAEFCRLSELRYGEWFRFAADGGWSADYRLSRRDRHDVAGHHGAAFATRTEVQRWLTEGGATREVGGVVIFAHPAELRVQRRPRPARGRSE